MLTFCIVCAGFEQSDLNMVKSFDQSDVFSACGEIIIKLI